MPGIFKNRVISIMSLFVLCAIQNSLAAGGGSHGLISSELLKHANLKVLWESELPIKNNESVKQLLLLGSRVYVVTDQDFIMSLNRENGKTVFARTFKPAGLLAGGFKLYKNELIYVRGSQLIEIDATSGMERSVTDLGFGVTCPAARNSSFFYVAGDDRRLHILRQDDKVQLFEISADNDSMITSIIADNDFVIFATDVGNIISVKPNEPVRLWQFDAFGPIAGPVVRDFASLFFASKDTNVYRVDMVGLPERKRLVWRYQTEGVLDAAPRVTPEVVYQPVPGKGVTAIHKETGVKLWSVPGGADLLAEYKNQAYVITRGGTLVVMDNIKARKLYSVNFAEVSKFVANPVDEKMYVADKRGRMACLQPLD